MILVNLKDKYTKVIADLVTISIEDLTPVELSIINHSYTLFQDKLEEIKTLNDEVKRLSLELANLKAMNDDSSNDYSDEENKDYDKR